MPGSNKPSKLRLSITLILAGCWAVGFLTVFFQQEMPNTSVARLEIWKLIRDSWLSILNPFDYSAGPNLKAGWQYFGERIQFFVTAITLLTASWGLGNIGCRRLLSDLQIRKSEQLVIVLGTGISIQTLWIFACGLIGQLTPLMLLAPGALGGLIALLLMLQKQSDNGAPISIDGVTEEETSKHWKWFFILITFPFVLHIVLGGMTPPWDFDVREYHLQGPKEWFQAGHIKTLEHNVYTSFPFLSEMLSLAAMVLCDDWWQGAIAGKLTLAAFQLLSALAVFSISRRWLGNISAWIATAAFLSTPWISRISNIAYAEGAITFYLIASVMVALLASGCEEPRSKTKLIAIAGFLAGSAMASKYPGVVSVVLPVGLYLLATIIQPARKTKPALDKPEHEQKTRRQTVTSTILLNAAVFIVAVVVAVGPWLVKNAVATGNPVYPLAYSVFGSSDWSPQMDAKWKKGHSPPERELIRIPNHLADVAIRNDWQSGFLFAFAVPALLLARKKRTVFWLSLHACWLLATWWVFTHRIDRFWIPLIPVAAVLAGSAWQLSRSIAWRGLMIGALSVCMLFNYGLCRYSTVIGFHGGLIELATARKLPIREDIRYLNTILKPNARVLLVGEAEAFDMQFDVVYNTVFDESVFQEWTSAEPGYVTPAAEQNMRSADEIRELLKQNGITHIYVNWSEVLRYRLTYGYTDYVYPQRFSQLQEIGVLDPPTDLSAGLLSKLSDQQQRELRSWQGCKTLFTDTDSWTNIQLFRVTGQ